MQDEQELPGQGTHLNEIFNSVGEAIDGNYDPSQGPDHMIDAENTIIDEPDCTLDSMEINIVGEANESNGHPSQESDVTVNAENSNVAVPDIICGRWENSNVDEPNIHDSSKTNDGNAEQTDSIVDGDVEQNDVSQNSIQGLQNETVSKDVGMEKADETTNVNGETSFIDPGNDLSIQGGVEMNNAIPLEGSSVILEEQDIVLDGDDQTSNSEEFKWNDDGNGGYKDNSEVENDSSDLFVKLSWKHMEKNQTKSSELLILKMMMIEVKAASLTTVVSLKHLQLNHKVNLNYYSSLDYLR